MSNEINAEAVLSDCGYETRNADSEYRLLSMTLT